MAGWLVLNTDASKPEAFGDAAIGAILRQKPRPTDPMKVVAYISEVVGQMEIQEAEYHALIEGLKLALRHRPDDLQVVHRLSDRRRPDPPRSAEDEVIHEAVARRGPATPGRDRRRDRRKADQD